MQIKNTLEYITQRHQDVTHLVSKLWLTFNFQTT